MPRTNPVPSEPIALEKAALRRSLLKARQAMPDDLWREKSDRICDNLRRSPLFQNARTILAYHSFRKEPDLSPLFTLQDKRWGFPRCVGKEEMVWHSWSPHADIPLQAGAFGILEPHPESPILTPDEVDLILVPCVACDRRGYRLGYGGGFYDRMFSNPAWREKCAIGINFSESYIDLLPVEPWDYHLKTACTDVFLSKIQNL